MSQQAVQSQPLKSIVKDYIDNEILLGNLKEGEKINESRLCEKLNLSKSPVREALTELVAEGILSKEDYKGISVSVFSDKDIEELTHLRITLELMAVDYLVPYINKKTQNDLREIAEKIKVASDNNDYVYMAEVDLEFHQYIIKLAHNKILLETWGNIYRRFRLHLYKKNIRLHNIQAQYECHMKLVDLFTIKSYNSFKHHLTAHIL